ncbi:MAG: TetR/AcrR family transcriptional regulator [Desulfobacteraceae bacterium]|jgi:AcrR family transcriptional regulator
MLHSNHSISHTSGKNNYSRKAYHHGNLKKALITKALDIIREEGVAGLSLRKAARRVGVSHAAPAHHFGDLVGFLEAIAEEGFQLLLQEMEGAVNQLSDADPLTRLRTIGMSYITFALEHVDYFKVMHCARLAEKSLFQGLDSGRRKVYQQLVNCAADCHRCQLITADDPIKAGLFVWITIHGYAVLAVNGQMDDKGFQTDDGRLAEMVINMVCSKLQ